MRFGLGTLVLVLVLIVSLTVVGCGGGGGGGLGGIFSKIAVAFVVGALIASTAGASSGLGPVAFAANIRHAPPGISQPLSANDIRAKFEISGGNKYVLTFPLTGTEATTYPKYASYTSGKMYILGFTGLTADTITLDSTKWNNIVFNFASATKTITTASGTSVTTTLSGDMIINDFKNTSQVNVGLSGYTLEGNDGSRDYKQLATSTLIYNGAEWANGTGFPRSDSEDKRQVIFYLNGAVHETVNLTISYSGTKYASVTEESNTDGVKNYQVDITQGTFIGSN